MRAVAALWAMIMTKHEAATGNSASVSLQLTFGHLSDGSPPGTGPMTAKPRSARLSQALAAIEPTTRTSGAGKRGANRRARRMLAATKIDKATTRPSADGAARTTSHSWTTVWREATATPSMSPSIATPTCTPTPVRNPTSTVRDRKSARKPALRRRASRSRAAVSSVSMPTSAMYRSPPTGAMWESAPEKIAAVAESAATTRWRDEPKTAKAMRGRRTV